MSKLIYDDIGKSYSKYRRPDSRIVDRIVKYLSVKEGGTIADIGAGTGSYSYALAERGFNVKAIEPSEVMQAQAKNLANIEWITASGEHVPLPDSFVDGVIAILSFHHFANPERALKEMARIAGEGPIVFFTFDPRQIDRPWLAEYFPSIWDAAFKAFPPLLKISELIQKHTNRDVETYVFELPHDLKDYFAAVGWRKPEIYLDPEVRSCMSAFALADQLLVAEEVDRLRLDLESNEWERKYGWLKCRDSADMGYRFLMCK